MSRPSAKFPSVLWDEAHTNAALALASGKTAAEAGEAAGVTDRTIRNWLQDVEFAAEVDRLTLMVDVSSRAERLRIAMRVVRQMVNGNEIKTEKDLLDWIKYAQSETDGIKLDLANSLAAVTKDEAPVAGRGSDSGEPAEHIN